MNKKHIEKLAQLMQLSKCYSREAHLKYLPFYENDILGKLNYIYNPSWKEDTFPHQTMSFLLDCYNALPQRPDLASLHCWQAINYSYNNLLLSDSNYSDTLKDDNGIEKLIEKIISNEKYKEAMNKYLNLIPEKAFKYIASYLVKGYIINKESERLKNSGQKNIVQKHIPAAYSKLTKKVSVLSEILDKAFGKAFENRMIVCDYVTNKKIYMVRDKGKDNSKFIIQSFASKLKELFYNQEVTIGNFEDESTKTNYKINYKEKLNMLFFGILYASRCNNFHGNVEPRLDSIYEDEKTYCLYNDVFLVEYMIVAIALHLKGSISDDILNQIAENSTLML